MNIKKLVPFIVLFIITVGSAYATRYISYDFRDGILYYGGYTKGTNDLTGVNAIGYVCTNTDCSTVSSTLWNGQARNSGSKDTLVVEYPTTLESANGYGVFFYKPGYITWEQANITYRSTIPGESSTNPKFSNVVYLTKANMCRAQVDTFSITNNAHPNIPLVVNISASLDATTHAALNHAGPIDYVPQSLKNKYYSLNTSISLRIADANGNVVKSETKYVLIEFSGEKRTHFVWTPSVAGNYTATVTSFVVDDKCLNSQEMQAKSDFPVLSEEPDEMCYTLLNNLTAVPLFATRGDTVTISAKKLSNSIDGALTSLPTRVRLSIYSGTNLLHTETKHVPKNYDTCTYQDVTFKWNATVNGMLSLVMNAVAEDCPFAINLDETETINYFIFFPPACTIDSTCGKNRFIGLPVCQNGDVYQDYLSFTCNNPALETAYCSNITQFVKKEDCAFGCFNGACLSEPEGECSTDAECGTDHFAGTPVCSNSDVYDYYITNKCNNPGTSSSYCSNNVAAVLKENCDFGCVNGECTDMPVTCSRNSDCGTDHFLNMRFCSGDDLFDYFVTYTCNNPGAVSSYCSDLTTTRLRESCVFVCVNNACVDTPITCYNDTQCDDSNSRTLDMCLNPGTPNSYCIHTNITCFNNNECDDSNPRTEDVCINPGTASSYCTHTNVTCITNDDCALYNTFTSGPFCLSNDLYRTIKLFICNNPGTVSSYCVADGERNVLVEMCNYGCANGACTKKEKQESSSDLYVSDISFGIKDRFYISKEMYFSISLLNEGYVTLDDLSVSIVIYDLGVHYAFGEFDLKKGDKVTKSRVFDIPSYISPGKYDVRVVISNDNIRRVIHREVVIV
jgi:hypothetical protein